MTEEKALEIARAQGMEAAQELQAAAPGMTGTELNAADDRIPWFREAVKRKNMLERTAGQKDGFVCRSSAGRVVRLIQNYDSGVYKQEPEELPAQWRFVWSKDPAKARPFIALSTSPYAIGDCCLNAAGEPKVSNLDNNVYDPDENPQYWDDP